MRRIITQVNSGLVQKCQPLSVYYNKKRSRFIVDLACLNKSTRLEVCKNVVSDDELKALVEAKIFSVLDF